MSSKDLDLAASRIMKIIRAAGTRLTRRRPAVPAAAAPEAPAPIVLLVVGNGNRISLPGAAGPAERHSEPSQ